MKLVSPFRLLALAALFAALPVAASAQISFTSAVDLALRNSPRVRSAQAQVDHARAQLDEAHDVYVPAISAGADFGEAIGYSPYPPTLFSITANSLVFNFAQKDYIRSSRSGLEAAKFALKDVQETVSEDAALAFVALDHDQQQQEALAQQLAYTQRLVDILQDRFNAGYASKLDLDRAKRTAAQIKLNRIHAQSTLETDRDHLASLLGIPSESLRVAGGFPDDSFPQVSSLALNDVHTPAIDAAFATAHAKQEQAFGDSRFLWRPQISLIIQYNHYATFTDAFQQIKNLYKNNVSNDNQVYALNITVPLFDRARSARARQTAADAVRAYNDAQYAQKQIFDAQSRLSHALTELQARAEVAKLDQQVSQDELEAVRAQLNATAPVSNGPALTPDAEQNALIDERAKYLSLLDAGFQLRQSEISILRQTGRLEQWIHSLPASPSSTLPSAPAVSTPQP